MIKSEKNYGWGEDIVMDWEKGEGTTASYFVFGAACSEVEIDCLTGDHKRGLSLSVVFDSWPWTDDFGGDPARYSVGLMWRLPASVKTPCAVFSAWRGGLPV
eukprot:g39525.t1